MKKKSYLWFGLALPAVVGGVTALLKTRKDNHLIPADKKLETSGSNTVITNLIHEQPDLDKDINQPERKSAASARDVRRVTRPIEKADKTNNSKKILTGAKGGKYYLNEKGDKVYVKK